MANILVVDDAAFMRMIVKDTVTKLGHTVIGEGVNGKEAADKYKELKPDLVIMDITMPEVNGIEGLKRIMQFDSKAKVLICSAMGQEFLIIEAIKSGALDFIVKPFKVERFRLSIDAALARRM